MFFPNARAAEIELTSPATEVYNCVAWAVRCEDRPIWPDEEGQLAWPSSLPREDSLANFLTFFRMCGFVHAGNSVDDPEMEYIALYTREGYVSHVARTTDNERYRSRLKWTSKLGSLADVHHLNAATIENESYGQATHFMRRPYRTVPPRLPLMEPPPPRLIRPDGSRLF